MPEILSSWKEIASFFGKAVRTVQRWERTLGMPVHRPDGDRQIIFADPNELRQWALRTQVDTGTAAETDSSYTMAG